MAEGWKQIVTNTQERAISSDQNRAQKVHHKDIAEAFRFMFDVFRSDDDTIGTVTAPNTAETPLRAEIIEGLLCKPQLASTDVFVDPGCVFLMAPDAAPDESNYKFVNDAGVSLAGTLTIGANASGFTRIDVVECRMNPVDLTATESRDVFDPVTGLFTATVVTKERQGRLEYRVRAGTPALGMPANALGWLPLMVASVPNGSANNDVVTFWDVRPLVADRERGFNLTLDQPKNLGGQAMGLGLAASGEQAGEISIVDFNGRRLGGRLRSSMPATAEVDSFDWLDADNWELGAVPAPNSNVFAYFLTPFDLPRWARYAAAPAARLPRAPRGLVVLSLTGPDERGRPLVAIAMPPSSGLVGTTAEGVCFAQTRNIVGIVEPVSVSGRVQMWEGFFRSVVGVALAAGNADFVPVKNSHFPQHARAIYAILTITRSIANATQEDIASGAIQWFFAGNAGNHFTSAFLDSETYINNSGGALVITYTSSVLRIPVPSEYPALALTAPMLIRATWSGALNTLTPDSAILNILGFEL